jgi:ubiquinone/menaquinone biosynthesis C-methylase UbiE
VKRPGEVYDELAPYYDFNCSTAVDAQDLLKVRDLISRHGITNGTILDVGCGTGMLKEVLGDGFVFTGVDESSSMLEKAEARQYNTLPGSMETVLPKIASKSFDYVVAVSSVMFVQDVYWVLEEFRRIARHGVVVTLDDITPKWIQEFGCQAYNHTKIKLDNLTEDIYFYAWHSLTTGETINARLIFERTSHE